MKRLKEAMGISNIVMASSFAALQYFGSPYFFRESKQSVVVKENGQEVEVPNRLSSLIETVMKDIKLEKENVDKIKPFLCTGLTPVHFGHVNYSKEVWLGLPQNFTVSEKVHVKLSAVISDFEASGDSPETQTLKSSIVLSEKAKKFAIAQNIYEVTNLNFIQRLSLPFVAALITNCIVWAILSSSKKKIKFLVLTYVNNVLLAVITYLFVLDSVNLCSQTTADYEAAKLGKSYIEGGIEYYEKVLERNKALKKLNKKAKFTNEGEISSFSFVTRIKYKTRLEFLKKFQESDETPSLWKYTLLAWI